jgi:hypothetical protein
MSETRALRQKLEEHQAELRRAREYLEKLRAFQSREREVLQRELEAARREVEELRAHLEERPSSESAPEPPPDEDLSEPESEPGPGDATTALVALARNPASMDSALPKLAKLLNLTLADVRFRMGPQPPSILARLPLAQASELRAVLRAEGFLVTSYAVPPRGVSRVMVKRFSLEEHGLSVESLQGERLRVSYAQLRLLMKGRRTTTQVESQQVTETVTHHFGGVHQHRVSRTVEDRRVQVENYLWVLGKGCRLAFTQATNYTGLDKQRAASVFENLQRLTQELRRRAPHAVVDERFFQMSRFVMPLVEPERSQELLAEVLFQAIEEGLWT